MNARKPLELRIYPTPQPPGMTPEDEVHRAVWCADRELEWRLTQHKRLTDAELAAEMWRSRLKVCSRGNRDVKRVGHPCVEWRAAHDEYDTLHRFATLPHYDEADQ